jgi:NitT/TauT family transport system ATP-binding protein
MQNGGRAMKIENLSKSYGENKVYQNFNLQVDDGKVTCILGQSGSGKTTLLNVVAGLTDYEGKVTCAKPSYIFQTPRLVPNLTVYGNLKLVCSDDKKIEQILADTNLSDKAGEYPNHLSGGQAQRVALCRAFLYDSDLLLMDEPFSSLDLKLKIKMIDLFKSLLAGSNKTTLFVTHDIDEALYLSDKIIVIDDGKIVYECAVEKKEPYGQNQEYRQKLMDIILK